MVSYRSTEAAVSPPPSPRVAFEETVVTGVSRPMNNNEHWALYAFELHARDCKTCQHPHRVQRHGKHLCDVGNAQAVEIVSQLYSTRSGHIYSTTIDEGNAVRVEIPDTFFEAKDLLRAIERSIRHKEPFISKSRLHRSTEQRRLVERAPTMKEAKVYHGSEKLERSQSVKKSKDYHGSEKKYHGSEKKYHGSEKKSHTSPRRSPEVVEWPQEEHPQRRATVSNPTTTQNKNHAYPVVINQTRTGAVAERQLHEKPIITNPTTTARPQVVIERANNNASMRGSLYLADKAELEKREARESKMAYKLEVREPSSPEKRERRKVYRVNNDRYWQ